MPPVKLKSLVTFRLPVPVSEEPPERERLTAVRLLPPVLSVPPLMFSMPVPVTLRGAPKVELPRLRLSEPLWMSTSPLLTRLK